MKGKNCGHTPTQLEIGGRNYHSKDSNMEWHSVSGTSPVMIPLVEMF